MPISLVTILSALSIVGDGPDPLSFYRDLPASLVYGISKQQSRDMRMSKKDGKKWLTFANNIAHLIWCKFVWKLQNHLENYYQKSCMT